jgi:hypothetical protein
LTDAQIASMLGAPLDTWQLNYKNTLLNGPHNQFDDIGPCYITMSTSFDVRYNVNADCSDVKWDALSEEEKTFAADAFMEAYREVIQEDAHVEYMASAGTNLRGG